jgi:O-antigen ligase
MVEGTTFVGIGVDQYREVSADKAPVHNIYLLLWAEGGLFALAGWVALLVILAMGALAARRTDKLAAALGLSVLSTFIIFSNAAPHMYARMWVVPLLLAMSPAFVINAAGASRRSIPGAAGWNILRRRRLT